MSTQDPAEREALKNEIQAAIAAGRELSPEMDRHLAESALDRYQQERAARERALQPRTAAPAPAPVPRSGAGVESIARAVVTVGALAAFVAILAFAPEYWWVIFFMPGLLGWWGWGRWHGPHQQGTSRQEYREARRRLRIEQMQAELDRLRSHPHEYD